jgi:hypothetical protein
MESRMHFPVLVLVAGILLLSLQSPAAADIGDCEVIESTPTYTQMPDTLALILVEFTDVRHDSFFTGGSPQKYESIYKWRHFYNMLVRRDY